LVLSQNEFNLKSERDLVPYRNSIKKLIIAGAFGTILAVSTVFAQSIGSLAIDDVVKNMVAHNDRAAAARYMEKAETEKIGPAGAWDDPMLMIGVNNLPSSGSFTMDDMTMKMIGLSQKIPYAGQKGLQKEAAKYQAAVASEDTRQTALDLATAARNAYLNLYYRLQALKLIQSQRAIQNDIVTASVKRLSTDQASQADVAAAQADLWRLDADILSSQQDIEASFNELYALMGQERPDSLPILTEPGFNSISPNLNAWLLSAWNNYPSLKRARNQANSYFYSSVAAKRMRWPMLELAASYGIRQNGPFDPMTGGIVKRDNMISFQANISLPIFSRKSQGDMASSMNAMRQSAEAEANQTWLETKATLETLFASRERLAQSLDLYNQRIIPADQDAYKSASIGYASNRVPFVGLLNYAMNIYRDRLAANQIAYQLALNMVRAGQYISNPDEWK
jgi:outer membrane protein, heavy metal efflux system